MPPKALTTNGLTLDAPVLGTPTPAFYSILLTGPLFLDRPVLGRPKFTTFHRWTIPPNWERPVTEEVTYRTEVIRSRDGTEQRIAQRINPRYSFNFGIRVTHDDAATLERALAKRQAFNYGFQHPRSVVLSDRGHPGAAGFIGRLEGEVSVTARTDRVMDMDVRMTVNPGVYGGDYLVGYTHPPADTFHNDREVLTLRPNWAEPVRVNFGQLTEILDRQRGVTDFNAPERFTHRIIQIGILIRSEAQENRLRGLFERVRGQQGEFYVVDPLSAQFMPVVAVTAGTTILTIPGRMFADRFASEAIYRNIAFRTASGMLYRKIASVSIVSGNSRITLTSSLPEIAVKDLIGIHWMLKARFATDALVFSWETDITARVTLNIRALEDT